MRFCNSDGTTRHYTAVGSQYKVTNTVGKKWMCRNACGKSWQSFICLLGKHILMCSYHISVVYNTTITWATTFIKDPVSHTEDQIWGDIIQEIVITRSWEFARHSVTLTLAKGFSAVNHYKLGIRLTFPAQDSGGDEGWGHRWCHTTAHPCQGKTSMCQAMTRSILASDNDAPSLRAILTALCGHIKFDWDMYCSSRDGKQLGSC